MKYTSLHLKVISDTLFFVDCLQSRFQSRVPKKKVHSIPVNLTAWFYVLPATLYFVNDSIVLYGNNTYKNMMRNLLVYNGDVHV